MAGSGGGSGGSGAGGSGGGGTGNAGDTSSSTGYAPKSTYETDPGYNGIPGAAPIPGYENSNTEAPTPYNTWYNSTIPHTTFGQRIPIDIGALAADPYSAKIPGILRAFTPLNGRLDQQSDYNLQSNYLGKSGQIVSRGNQPLEQLLGEVRALGKPLSEFTDPLLDPVNDYKDDFCSRCGAPSMAPLSDILQPKNLRLSYEF